MVVIFFPGFKALAHFLCEKHLRERLVGFLLKDTAHWWAERLFKEGTPKPAEWRWGVVIECLQKM